MVIGNERNMTISPEFAKKLAEHEARAAEIRKEIGDPAEALSRAVRNAFTLDVLLSSIRLDENGDWLGFTDDEDDEWPRASST